MKVNEIKVSYRKTNVPGQRITNSNDAYAIVLSLWNQDTIEMQEEVKVIYLDNNNTILGTYDLAKGGLTNCIIDNKLILSVALKCLAIGIILIHNHPSGNLKPSNSDIRITRKLKDTCDLLDIKFLDHLIISKDNYYSLLDNGDLDF